MSPLNTAKRSLSTLGTAFLPFLYQTRTILNYTPSRFPSRIHALVRRLSVVSEVASRRVPYHGSENTDDDLSHDVPFEGEQPAAFHKQRKSTITETERKTFDRLFKQYTSAKSPKGRGLNNITDDLSDATEDTLDSILDSAIAELEPSATTKDAPAGLTPEARRKLMRSNAIIDEDEETPLRRAQKEQFQRVEKMMTEAKSDVELWNVLEREVFSVIRRLELDALDSDAAIEEQADQRNDSQLKANAKSYSELQVVGPNYPSFMLIAMRQLRVDFPGSTLGLALLPAIKSLGRGSFALGASTELYNELLAMTWLTYSDFQGLDDLLQEMENGGINFDANTLDLLDSIKKNALDARSGRLGDGATAVLEMDRFQRGLRRLQRWRDAIRLRMEAEAIRQAKEYEVQL